MNFDKAPSLKEFAEVFNRYLNDVGCINNPEGYIASHKIVGKIGVVIDNELDDFEIVGIDMDQLGGCGCFSDITLKIRKINN